MIDQEHLNM